MGKGRLKSKGRWTLLRKRFTEEPSELSPRGSGGPRQVGKRQGDLLRVGRGAAANSCRLRESQAVSVFRMFQVH